MCKPVPVEHFKIMEKKLDKILSWYLKDPNCTGWSIIYSPTCNDPKIMVNKQFSSDYDHFYSVEIVLCFCISN